MIPRIDHEIPHHLRRLGVLHPYMLLLAHGLHEILMHQFSHLAPPLAIVHDEQMVALGDEVRDDGVGPVAVDVAFLVEEVLDEFAVRDDEGGVGEAFQAEDAAVFARPLRQSDGW